LCGRYNSRAHGVARLCRHCTTPTLLKKKSWLCCLGSHSATGHY
jgi:hypothetical protein